MHGKNKTIGEMKFKAITTYTQHIKHLSCSYDLEDQQDLPQQMRINYFPFRLTKIYRQKRITVQQGHHGGIFSRGILSPLRSPMRRINVFWFPLMGSLRRGHS
jgi:hypothetical protein